MFVDLKMPGMDGLALIRQARSSKPGLPVIVVTGYSSEASAIEALNMGVSADITKPFRVPQVLEAATRALAS
jgi:DNA-binding NtrC family response regulator